MGEDIVERLRAGALSGDLPLGAAINWSQIADEIERLRAENDRLHDLIGAPFRCTSTEQYDAAMAALSRETVRWLLAAATTENDRGR